MAEPLYATPSRMRIVRAKAELLASLNAHSADALNDGDLALMGVLPSDADIQAVLGRNDSSVGAAPSPCGHDYHTDPVVTQAGGRIAAATWFTQGGTKPAHFGAVLVHTSVGEARAYIGMGSTSPTTTEAQNARYIAAWGARLADDVARALWPSHFRRYDASGSLFPTI